MKVAPGQGADYRSAFINAVYHMYQKTNNTKSSDLTVDDFDKTSDETLLLILENILEQDSKVKTDYKREFIENGDRIYGAGGLKNAEGFNKWYISTCDNMNEETVRKGLSPETTYLAICIDDGHLVGMINIRHRLNDFLLKFGGHIDYSVRKSQRHKGYATEMLGLALKECARLNIKKVLITCDKNNIASAKTMLNNGAKLENEITEKNKISQKYWITIN